MKRILFFCTAFFMLAICSMNSYAQVQSVDFLSTAYVDSVFDEGATEIVTYDPVSQRIFSTNGYKSQIDIFDVSNPSAMVRIDSIEIDSIGAGANSVAFKNGILAAAIKAFDLTENGYVAMYDADGNYLRKVEVGANPDMVCFTHNGNFVLTANEGEHDSEDFPGVNPEGSISIIDISNGIPSALVSHATFDDYNDKKYHLKNKGIRIYDSVLIAEVPTDLYMEPTVAQDLEPEYVAIAPNDSIAYVTCQENNAIAVVNIHTAEVMDIYAVGYKDHSKGSPMLSEYYVNMLENLPALGTPVYDGAETVMLGGFSGLYFDHTQSDADNYVFYAIPDRGPNDANVKKANVTGVGETANPSQNIRPFKLPDYQSRLVKITLDVNSSEITLDDNQLMLYGPDGTTPISGKGNIPGVDEVPVTYIDDEVYTDTAYLSDAGVAYAALEYDQYGGDFEGVLRDVHGNFWMCDEYRPAIYKFGANGVMKKRFVAEGTAALGDAPQTPGFYGDETLPAVYAKRRANRGFEAIAYDSTEHIIYAFIQSPMYNPSSATKNKSDVIRILGIDTLGTPVAEYVYLLERNRDAGYALGRVDKIGDACYVGNKRFIVLERDLSVPGEDEGKKYVYTIDLKGATNILGTPLSEKTTSTDENDKTLEMMTADDLATADIKPVFKIKTLNLPSIGYLPSDKPEGLALLPNGSLAVINDNDFGLAGAGVSDNSVLGIIDFKSNFALDGSDKDGAINIANWPVYGMFMPDAITTYERNGKTYFVVANEGDDRGEDKRIEKLTLDPDMFPNAANLQTDDAIGRLKVSSIDGDIDGDGDYDYLYPFGGRSFTIFDAYGNLVFDSGDDFEQITAELIPDYFNTDNDNNDFDDKSDAQGPEPEAIEIGSVKGEYYAFIGMEDVGGFFTYNITNPYAPEYIQYNNNREFVKDPGNSQEDYLAAKDLGIEDIVMVKALESSNDNDMLIVANEVSGTISTFGVESLLNLSILHNNDGESDLLPNSDEIGGVAQFRSVVNKVRLEDGANLMLSSGDNFLAGPEFNASLELESEETYYDALAIQKIGYDAICIGNHDFDFGPDVLAKFIEDVDNAPYLSANLNFEDEESLQNLVDLGAISSRTVINMDAEKIGVIGLTTPQLTYISSPRGVEVSTYIVDTVQAHVDALAAEGINKIILISHLQSINEDTALIAQVSGIDVAIAGGGDELLTNDLNDTLPGMSVWGEYPYAVEDLNGDTTYIITAPGGYKFLGRLNVTFNDAGKIVDIDSTSGPIKVEGVLPDAELLAAVEEPIEDYIDELASNVIATSEVDINGVKANLRTRETNEGNLITDALLWQAKQLASDYGVNEPDVALQNGGGIRNNSIIPAGDITELTTWDMLPFSNFVSVIEGVTPAEFKSVLENAVSKVESESGRFAQVAGCYVEYSPDSTGSVIEDDVITTVGLRVVNVTLEDGTKIIENGQIVAGAPNVNIATIDFLARGGDQYPYESDFTSLGTTYQQALYNYITDDGNGGLDSLIAAADYPVEGVGRVNAIPSIEGTLDDVVEDEGFGSVKLDIAGLFSDFEDHALTYDATSADPSIVTTTIADTIVTITEAGTGETKVAVTATDIHNAVSSLIIGVTVEGDDTGIELTELSSVRIYPNPAYEFVTIELSDINSKVEIIDVAGNTVYSDNPFSSSVKVDMTEMPAGLYFVKVESANGTHVVNLMHR